MKISIITPTYNRGKILRKLYESLEQQSLRVYEWVIVDDGSTDHTSQIVDSFIGSKKNILKIIYLRQNNQGKHVAVNMGLNIISGEYFAIVDSDDFLVDSCLSEFSKIINENNVSDNNEIIGVSGSKCSLNGLRISSLSPNGVEIMTHLEWFYLQKRYGDRLDFCKAKAFSGARFNVFLGEKFQTEDFLWLSVSGNKLFTNQVMLIGDYLPEGLTSKSKKLMSDNPMGAFSFYRLLFMIFPRKNFSTRLKISALIFFYGILAITKSISLHIIPAIFLFPLITLKKNAKK